MIFLDTGFLLALVSKRDENHERALEVLNSYRGRSLWEQVITTNHVVAEALTAIRFKAEPTNLPKGHAQAVEIGRGLYDGAFGKVYQVTMADEHAAFEIRNHLARPAAIGLGPIDPQHGIAAPGRDIALLNAAIAA